MFSGIGYTDQERHAGFWQSGIRDKDTRGRTVRKESGKIIIRALLFSGLGMILFLVLSGILIPKWSYPDNPDNVALSIKEARKMKADTLDAVFMGTSHIKCGVTPMHIYQEEGIISYNMATSGQALEVSLFLTSEVFKRQSPKVMVLDASNFFFNEELTIQPFYREVMDSFPYSFSSDRFRLIHSYIEDKYKETKTIPTRKDLIRDWVGSIFPFYYYHSRWNELQESDFLFRSENYFLKGYRMSPCVKAAVTDFNKMNEEAEQLRGQEKSITIAYDHGQEKTTAENKELYYTSVSEENEHLLQEIYNLCLENHCRLLITKVPVFRYPREYHGAWTRDKYSEVKRVTSKLGIDYVDLMYDVDVGLDPSKDYIDGGEHLNISGAQKVSSFLGKYLIDHYGLQPGKDEDFDQKAVIYNQAVQVAKLEMETDFSEYINALSKEKKRYAVMISAKDDMRVSLNERDIKALRSLGLEVDFSEINYGDSYLALIDQGSVIYESTSNRMIRQEAVLQDSTDILMESAGYYTGNKSSIILNNIDYSKSGRGLNIVVYDYKAGQVADSVCFDTHDEEHKAVHYNPRDLFQKFIWFLCSRT